MEADPPGQSFIRGPARAVKNIDAVDVQHLATIPPMLQRFGKPSHGWFFDFSAASCDAFNIPRKILISF